MTERPVQNIPNNEYFTFGTEESSFDFFSQVQNISAILHYYILSVTSIFNYSLDLMNKYWKVHL